MDVKYKKFILLLTIGIPFIVGCHRKPVLSPTLQSLTSTATQLPAASENISVLPITLSPSQEVHYKLTLVNSGPVVVDSAITFTATLKDENSKNAQETETKQYIFQWVNMANAHMQKTVNSSMAEVSLTFNGSTVSPGEYTMTVAAFPVNDSTKMIAYKTMKFVLTEKLNGNLIFRQNLNYQRYPTVFATNQYLAVAVDLHDTFLDHKKAEFYYSWYKNGEIISLQKVLKYNFTKSESFSLNSLIGVNLENNKSSVIQYNDNVSKPFQAVLDDSSVDAQKLSKSYTEPVCYFSKCGQFEQFLVLKDTLHSCHIRRVGFEPWDKAIALGKPTVFNISCSGSSPSAICFTVTPANCSIPRSNICYPEVFLNTLNHLETISFFNVSWIDIHFFIYNDVSRIHLVQTYDVYNADAVNLPALVFPIVFGTLGILVIIAGAAHIMKLRKKPFVEVADFDFCPNLTDNHSNTNSKFSTVVITIKRMFSRNNFESNHRDSQKCLSARPLRKTQTNCYDSL